MALWISGHDRYINRLVDDEQRGILTLFPRQVTDMDVVVLLKPGIIILLENSLKNAVEIVYIFTME